MRFCNGAAEKHIIHTTDLKTAMIGGEMLPEPLPVAPSTHLTPSPSTHDEEGVVHPLDYGDCGSNLYRTLSHAL
jgi:hypothetical protein